MADGVGGSLAMNISRSKIEPAAQSCAAIAPALPDARPSSYAHPFNSWLRDFSWLTAQRVRFYSSVLLLAYLELGHDEY